MVRLLRLLAIIAILMVGPLLTSSASADHGDAADATPEATPHDDADMDHGHGDMSGTGAAYMLIENTGDEADRLIGGATAVAEVVEIHEIVDVSGVMNMRPLAEGLEIPAGAEVLLEPGGYHVMLIGLTESLEPNMTFDLVLTFEHMGEVIVPVVVQGQSPEGDDVLTVDGTDLTITGAWSRPAPMLGPETPATPAATPHA